MAANRLSNNISSQSGSTTGNRTVEAADQVSTQVRNVAIFWDIENCQVPAEVVAEDVADNIRLALQKHPETNGAVTTFKAYGVYYNIPARVHAGCSKTGVDFNFVVKGKNAADNAILLDMLLFANDNRPPFTIFLISGDGVFSAALHKLKQRGYTVVLAVPSGDVAKALHNAGRFVWDWPNIAGGGDPFSHVGTSSTQSYTLNSKHKAADLSGNQLAGPSAQPRAAISKPSSSSAQSIIPVRRSSSAPIRKPPLSPSKPSFSSAQSIIPVERSSSALIPPPSLFTDDVSSGTSSYTSRESNSTHRVQRGYIESLNSNSTKFVNTAGGKKPFHPVQGKGGRGGGRGRQFEEEE